MGFLMLLHPLTSFENFDFMPAGEKLTDFTSLSSPYNFKKNDNIILSYFKDE